MRSELNPPGNNTFDGYTLRRELLRIRGMLSAAVVVVLLWGMSLNSHFIPWDDLIYDQLIRFLPDKYTATHDVVLVETPSADSTVSTVAIRNLLAAGARHVATLQGIVPDVPLSDDEMNRLTRASVLPRELPPSDSFALTASEIPAALAPNPSGLFLEQYGVLLIGGKTFTSLEGQVANRLQRTDIPTMFRVNFHQGRHLPKLPLSKLVSVRSIEAVVRDKVVLIGPGGGTFAAELPVPGTGSDRLVTRAEFHALALDTLLQRNEVGAMAPLPRLFFLLGLGAVLLLVFQPLPLRQGFAVASAILATFVVLAVVLLQVANHWLPVQAITFVIIGVFVVTYREKARDESRRIASLMTAMEERLHQRVMPKTFDESQEHWSHIVKMVDQTLHLNRSIFLDRVLSDHRVKEIAAVNCSLDAINELRRDYEREPYTLAIAARSTIEIPEQRRFLRPGADDERQYMAPFIIEGEILGFWAMGVSAGRIADEGDFLDSVNAMAEQVAYLLYQRKVWLRHQEREGSVLSRYVQDDTATRLTSLQQAIAALDRRTRGLEHLFSGLSTAAILYDLFGRVVLINQRMSDLLASNGWRPYDNTAHDLITALTGITDEQSREVLGRMLGQSAPAQFEVRLSQPVAAEYLLIVRPLAADQGDASHEPHPFNLYGFVIELLDIGEINRGFQRKLDLVEYITRSVREEFAETAATLRTECLVAGREQAVHFDASAIPHTADRGNSIAPGLQQRMAGVNQRLDELQRLLEQPVRVGDEERYPILAESVLRQLHERCAAASRDKNINWSISSTAHHQLCLANQGDLTRLLDACANRLLDDATSDSSLNVLVEDDENEVRLTLSNVGFGMPPERLAALIAGEGAAVTGGDWDTLRKAAARCRRWGATMSADAELGGGLRFRVGLPAYR